MIVLALLVTVAAGARRSLSFSFLLGSGVTFVAMLLLSLVGIEWSRWTVIAALIVIAAAARFVPLPLDRIERTPLSNAIDLVTAAFVVLYALYATAGAPWHWDFWAIWGLKGRAFFEAHGIDWRFLGSPSNAFAHADYPLLVPLQYAFAAVLEGAWNERWLGLLFAAYVAAAAGAVRRITSRNVPPVGSAAIAFAVAALVASQFVGLAEVPLIAFGTVGVLLARDARYTGAALFLGLAASTKNEGLTLVAAVALAVLVRRRADVIGLWPVLVVALPWRIVAAAKGFGSYLAAGLPLERIAAHLSDWRGFGALLVAAIDKPYCWLFVLLSLPFIVARERFVLTIVIVQFAFIIAAFLATPFDLVWHITTSWDRLSRQLLVLSSYAALMALAGHAAGRTTEHAETRSLQH